MKTIQKSWHWIIVSAIFIIEAAVLFFFRDKIYVGICDNLDLFITQLKVLRDQHAFFAQGAGMPMMQNLDRDYFPSEWSLYNLLYLILPDLYAYITGFLLKIVIALGSSILLAKTILKERYVRYEKAVVLAAGAFAFLPLYPMYAICFASIPLVVYLLIQIYRKPKILWFAALFVYPFVSYFTFFGAFILGYLLLSAIYLWIRDKKCPLRLFVSVVVLLAGYVCFEYRLFQIMIFSDVATIRETMVIPDFDFKGLWNCTWDVFFHGVSHANAVHTCFVLPVCGIYFALLNASLIRKKQYREIIRNPFNLILLFILFNSIVYALYYWEPMRNLVASMLPPLKGFQYGRTAFFNPIAWYMAFFLVLKACYDHQKPVVAAVLGILAIMVVCGTQTEYNDFYNTCYHNLYRMVKGTEGNQLSYGEFYAKDLFEQVKQDAGYQPDDEACAYGFHPAVLEYNGITTIDGYCGYYSQDYKDKFRDVIAPTLDHQPGWKQYYDEWACRAYLFPPEKENLYDFGANSPANPIPIEINEQALADMGCKYIFSRFEITNSTEEKLELVNRYETSGIPYSIYLYRLQ